MSVLGLISPKTWTIGPLMSWDFEYCLNTKKAVLVLKEYLLQIPISNTSPLLLDWQLVNCFDEIQSNLYLFNNQTHLTVENSKVKISNKKIRNEKLKRCASGIFFGRIDKLTIWLSYSLFLILVHLNLKSLVLSFSFVQSLLSFLPLPSANHLTGNPWATKI